MYCFRAKQFLLDSKLMCSSLGRLFLSVSAIPLLYLTLGVRLRSLELFFLSSLAFLLFSLLSSCLGRSIGENLWVLASDIIRRYHLEANPLIFWPLTTFLPPIPWCSLRLRCGELLCIYSDWAHSSAFWLTVTFCNVLHLLHS